MEDANRMAGKALKRILDRRRKEGGVEFRSSVRAALETAMPELAQARVTLSELPGRFTELCEELSRSIGVIDSVAQLNMALAGEIGEGWDRATTKQIVVAAMLDLDILRTKIGHTMERAEASIAMNESLRFTKADPYTPVQRALMLYGEPGLSDVTTQVIADVAMSLSDEVSDDMWSDAIEASDAILNQDGEEIDLATLSPKEICGLLDTMIRPSGRGIAEVIHEAVRTTIQVVSHLVVDCMKNPGMIERWVRSYQARPQGGMFSELGGGSLSSVEEWAPPQKLVTRSRKVASIAIEYVFNVSFGMEVVPPWAEQLTAAFGGILVHHAAYAAALIPILSGVSGGKPVVEIAEPPRNPPLNQPRKWSKSRLPMMLGIRFR
jgi:hypothetical protein